MEGANFAQRTFSSTFRGGSLAGRSIGDVAGDLGSGTLTPKDVPVGMIVREGNSLILNTRPAQALMQAGIPRSAWSVIDQTGDPFFEELLTGQLTSIVQGFWARLLIVLVPGFGCSACLGFAGRCGVLPGVPGRAPAPTAPGLISFRAAGIDGAGQAGAGRAHSRCQQVRNARFQGQSGLILRTRWRAWWARRAGMCQIR